MRDTIMLTLNYFKQFRGTIKRTLLGRSQKLKFTQILLTYNHTSAFEWIRMLRVKERTNDKNGDMTKNNCGVMKFMQRLITYSMIIVSDEL
jgi:hypothetical protein